MTSRRRTPRPRHPGTVLYPTADGDVLQQVVGEPGPVQAGPAPAPVGSGQPGDRQVQQRGVVSRADRRGTARTRVDGQHVAGVVAGCQVRAEPDAAFIGGLRVRLPRHRELDRRVQVDHRDPGQLLPATRSHGTPRPANPHQYRRNSATAALTRASCRPPVSSGQAPSRLTWRNLVAEVIKTASRHARWSHHWQPGGPMLVAETLQSGPMLPAGDSSRPASIRACLHQA